MENMTMDKITTSQRSGMGSILYSDGCAFRVWAPHADQVLIIGDFNNWSKTATPLANEGNGFWSTEVNGAKAGEQYKYLIRTGSREISRIDPYAREVACSICNSIIHDPDFKWEGDRFQIPCWNEMVIYEMHIGTFNYAGDDHPGTFSRAIEKLPYLKELGINAVEIMPIMEFAGNFSWGYNPALIFAIESEYGGAQAFKQFVQVAHTHGLAVIFDVVYNHWGPGDLDLWQFDGWHENDKGGIYFYNDWRSQTPWGETRPDYGRGEVRQYIRDNALMWLDQYRVDGLRWDATAFIRNVYGQNNDPEHDIAEGWSLMQWINQEIKASHPGKICIAEDVRNNSYLIKPVSESGAGFDAQWDSVFVRNVRSVVTAFKKQSVDLELLRAAIFHQYNSDVFKRIIYSESHDEIANGKSRIPQEVSPTDPGSWIAKKLSGLAAGLVFTAPGIPMIFQGQEFLEDEWFRVKDPLDWSKMDRYSGVLKLYRDLIRLRRNLDGYTRGLCGQHIILHHMNNEEKILAFHRYEQDGPGDSVIVIVNIRNQVYQNYSIGFPRAGVWNIRLNSDSSCYDNDFGNYGSSNIVAKPDPKDGMPYSGEIDIGPFSVLILSQDK
jgi:1,4-alpha-glucan branching enzyme